MRPRTEIPTAQAGAIRRAMLAARNTSTFQRLQCLRAKESLTTEAIARTVGLSVSHVRRVWSDYLRGGLPAAHGRPKGGRRHQHLTLAQEQKLFVPRNETCRNRNQTQPAEAKVSSGGIASARRT
jgi:hypothetical protein